MMSKKSICFKQFEYCVAIGDDAQVAESNSIAVKLPRAEGIGELTQEEYEVIESVFSRMKWEARETLMDKINIRYAPDRGAAYLSYEDEEDSEYKITVATYSGEGLRIWIDDYNPANEVTVNIEWEHERLVNPLNKETRRGAIVEKAIEIYENLEPFDYKFSYF
jgi:hypothetical protein